MSATPKEIENEIFLIRSAYETKMRLAVLSDDAIRQGTDIHGRHAICIWFPELTEFQLWFLETEQADSKVAGHEGFVYIRNVGRPNRRLCVHNDGATPPNVDALDIHYGDVPSRQLWQFTKYAEPDLYIIRNQTGYDNWCLYKEEYHEPPHPEDPRTPRVFDHCWGMAKYTPGHPMEPRALWQLVPLYKVMQEGSKAQTLIWSCDNRQGSIPFTESVEITRGVKASCSETGLSKYTFKTSLTLGLKKAFTPSLTAEFTRELSESISRGEEDSWLVKHKQTFKAAPRTWTKVYQDHVSFQGERASLGAPSLFGKSWTIETIAAAPNAMDPNTEVTTTLRLTWDDLLAGKLQQ